LKKLTNEKFVSFLCEMVVTDPAFLASHAVKLGRLDFGELELTWYIKTACDFWLEHGEPIPGEVLDLELSHLPDRKEFDKDAVLDFWDERTVVDSPAFAEYLIKYTGEWMQEQALQQTVADAAVLIGDGRYDEVASLFSTAAAESQALAEIDLGHFMFEQSDDFAAVMDDDFQVAGGGRMVPTGIFTLDQVLGGGLRAAELGIIMAPPGRGKSHFLCDLARNAAMFGFNAVYYTLEMPWYRVTQRMWSNIVDVNSNEFFDARDKVRMEMGGYGERSDENAQANYLDYMTAVARKLDRDTPEYLAELAEKAKLVKHGEVCVKAYPSGSATVLDLQAHLHALKTDGFFPDLVIVDYGDLLTAGKNYDQRRDELANIFTGLRGLAGTAGLPIWTATQANRAAMGKQSLTIANVADSWDKVKIADFIAALCQNENELTEQQMRLAFLKVRNNEAPAEVLMLTDLARSTFLDQGFYETRH